MNNLVLAYLGDAVYELYVREHLIKNGLCKVKDLQQSSVKWVSANAQARILYELLDKNFLKEEEIDVMKRGRNAHSHQNRKTDIITYKKATGFETLVGYLYFNDKARLEELMKEVLL